MQETPPQATPPSLSPRRDAPWLLGAMLLAIAGRSTCVSTEFQLDDYMHLYRLASLPLPRFLLQTYLGHVLVTFHAAFAVLHAAFGLHALAYYLSGLALHAVNTGLLYGVLRRYGKPALSAGCASLWGISPLHHGTLGWVSAIFGEGLIALFALSTLVLLTGYFARRLPVPRWALALGIVLLALGAVAYGAGIGVAFVFPAVAWLLTPVECNRKRVFFGLSPLCLVPVVYLAFVRYLDPTQGPTTAPDTFFSGLGAVTLLSELVAYDTGALVAGPAFAVSGKNTVGWPFTSTLPEHVLPVGLALAGVLVAWMGWTAVRVADSRHRRALLAFLLLFAASLGIIAAGRGALLWVPYVYLRSHYHYVPSAAAAAALGVTLSAWEPRASKRAVRLSAGLALGLYLALSTGGSIRVASLMQSPIMEAIRGSAATVRADLDAKIDAAPPGSRVLIENEAFVPVTLVMNVSGKSIFFPGLAAYFAMLHDEDTVRGRHVRFVERDGALLQAIWSGPSRRMKALFLGGTDEKVRSRILGDAAALAALRSVVERDPPLLQAVRRAQKDDPGLSRAGGPAEQALAMLLDAEAFTALHNALVEANGEMLRRRLDTTIDQRPPGATAFIDNEDVDPLSSIGAAGPRAGPPGLGGAFLALYADNRVRGRTVRFVVHDLDLARRLMQDPNPRVRELYVAGFEDALTSRVRRDPRAMAALRQAIEKDPAMRDALERTFRLDPSLAEPQDPAEALLVMPADSRTLSILDAMLHRDPATMQAVDAALAAVNGG